MFIFGYKYIIATLDHFGDDCHSLLYFKVLLKVEVQSGNIHFRGYAKVLSMFCGGKQKMWGRAYVARKVGSTPPVCDNSGSSSRSSTVIHTIHSCRLTSTFLFTFFKKNT